MNFNCNWWSTFGFFGVFFGDFCGLETTSSQLQSAAFVSGANFKSITAEWLPSSGFLINNFQPSSSSSLSSCSSYFYDISFLLLLLLLLLLLFIVGCTKRKVKTQPDEKQMIPNAPPEWIQRPECIQSTFTSLPNFLELNYPNSLQEVDGPLHYQPNNSVQVSNYAGKTAIAITFDSLAVYS